MVAGIGFYLFGIPNATFWGFVIAVFALIPVVGPPVVYIPASVILIYQGDFLKGAGLLAYGILIVTNIENFVRPKLVRMQSNIHPLVVILGVVGGLSFMGLSGIIIGPLILTLFMETFQTYVHTKSKK